MQEYHPKKKKLLRDKFVHILQTDTSYLCDCITGKYSNSSCHHVTMLSEQLIPSSGFAQLCPIPAG